MKYSPLYASFASILILTVFALALSAHGYPAADIAGLCFSLFFAVLTPVIVLIVRHQIRLNRLYVAEVFRSTFEPRLKSAVLIEFIRRKYLGDIPGAESTLPPARNLPRYPFTISSDWSLLIAGVPFIIFAAAGIFILLCPAGQVLRLLNGFSVPGAGDLSEPALRDYENAVTIASFAFASAFLYSLRLFVRALVAFDLSAITFLRAFAHMLLATALALILWRVAPEMKPLSEVAAKVQTSISGEKKGLPRQAHANAETPAIESGDAGVRAMGGASGAVPQLVAIPKVWLLFAFVLGFIPDAAFSWILQRARLTLNRRYAKVTRHGAVTPLTVIDGIDFLTAFRLDEGNIGNVQILAAANPIMIHVETSYCIFLIVDWIAQAQLCTAVGPQRFLLLRRLNIRTIFDLERAVLDPGTPNGLKQIVGAVLLANEGAKTSIFRELGIRPLDVTHRDFDKALTSWVNVEVVEHLVRIIIDNLHVHRFRQVWQEMEACLSLAKPDGQRASIFKMPPVQTTLTGQANGALDSLSHESVVALHAPRE